MSHLSTDRLADLADDHLTPDEATHLAGCWDCRAEVAAYRRLARLSATAPLPTEPLTAWSQLAPQLRADGIIVDRDRLEAAPAATVARPAAARPSGAVGVRALEDAGFRRLPARPPSVQVWAMRAAAGLALLIGGAALGRFTAPAMRPLDDVVAGVPMTPTTAYRSPDEAVRALAVAQQQYQSAAAFLASQDTSARFIGMNEDSYQARLAALDEIAAAARAALYRAPQDPMLNQYYLTTLGAREATLRQIGATAPAQRRFESY